VRQSASSARALLEVRFFKESPSRKTPERPGGTDGSPLSGSDALVLSQTVDSHVYYQGCLHHTGLISLHNDESFTSKTARPSNPRLRRLPQENTSSRVYVGSTPPGVGTRAHSAQDSPILDPSGYLKRPGPGLRQCAVTIPTSPFNLAHPRLARRITTVSSGYVNAFTPLHTRGKQTR
jgi:hypothetical protein